jgi:AraC-like DNA-binding protein
VAAKCGFPDAKYFATIFKREMGISPGKYTVHKTD